MFHSIVRDKVTRQRPQTTTFEERGEPKRGIRTEVPLPAALPLGQSGSLGAQDGHLDFHRLTLTTPEFYGHGLGAGRYHGQVRLFVHRTGNRASGTPLLHVARCTLHAARPHLTVISARTVTVTVVESLWAS